ncbi:16S rRNA (guanine(527)-N(7))-methyltransferase RsmG [Aquisalimonas asiatica]|uniref:Ribosomal RNA small subunit methyltransferase G n=1 Tax=Aquisalimonas asiatica TaxID=406100 RepID=A0A1H8UBC0_9GAMM|nr:16S rRNA (guanine(527)-N(7))-methyltransferase RsmG [Aquisalimonas asiatica]SEP00491.1 16S rRNA m(7)G-527 methyltransferase [Aquisalimonas asiatica]
MTQDFPRTAVTRAVVDGIDRLALPSAPPVDGLVDYLALLSRWNRAFNLSAVRDPLEMVPRHLLDSLATLPYVEGSRLLDVGSGAGLPGIPLALCRPELQVTLLDTNGKKTRFLRQAALELDLQQVTVVQDRIERWSTDCVFDTVIARAFARLDQLVQGAGRLVAPGGLILAMKGRFDGDSETAAMPPGWGYDVETLEVPGVDAARCVVRIRRQEATSGETDG